MRKTLSDWLGWLESLHPKDIELGLDRISIVAKRLDIFTRLKSSNTKVVTVAGTNGKGSCVATMETFALASGLTVGAYTSPHFLHFNERIRVNGAMVSDDALLRAFNVIERARESVSLTYFEYTTLAGLWIFCEADLDIWLLEVGLGGRLDAVNIIEPDVAVITSIALDHQDWLGNDRETIGREKAGIMRAGAPAICVDPDPPNSIAGYALEVGARLVSAGNSLNWSTDDVSWQFSITRDQADLRSNSDYTSLPIPSLPMPSVVAGLQALAYVGVTFDRDQVSRELKRLTLTGRNQQCWVSGRRIILDVAHNPAAAELLATRLSTIPGSKAAIFAVMADKDIPGICRPLLPLIDQWVVAGLENNPRAAASDDLQKQLAREGHAVDRCDTVRQAFERCIRNTPAGDTIVVFGSFYTVAEVLSVITAFSSESGDLNG
ncbi:bifunctional tetrahydrofolate synthase/dihydrofolate synthase [Aurantivibrio plasticivorans]